MATVWICEACRKEFDVKKECASHEKQCKIKTKRDGIWEIALGIFLLLASFSSAAIRVAKGIEGYSGPSFLGALVIIGFIFFV